MQRLDKRWRYLFVLLAIVCFFLKDYTPLTGSSSAGPAFVEFESGQVRPLAISSDHKTLFAVNTPNGTLEVFDLSTGLPVFRYRVLVGLEPVTVAVRNSSEVWVINHLSDSISIVTLAGVPHVVRTRWLEMNRATSCLPAIPSGLSLRRHIAASNLQILRSRPFLVLATRS